MPSLSADLLPPSPTLLLASRSPRRAQLLRDAGFDPVQITPDFQDPADPNQAPGISPGIAKGTSARGSAVALHLAQRKAARLPPEWITEYAGAVVITSDTVGIAPDGRLVGTPESRDQALAMLRDLINHTHTIATGVCLRIPDGSAESFVDTADVHLGHVADDDLQTYVTSDQWVGKAGGYNLIERQTAGWPITITGDSGTVMGLPMLQLTPRLISLGVARRSLQPADP